MAATKTELVRGLRNVEQLQYGDNAGLDAWLRRAEMVIRNVFGDKSQYLSHLNSISFSPMFLPAEPSRKRESWSSGKSAALNLVNTMVEELELFNPGSLNQTPGGPPMVEAKSSTSVFVVHGQDEAMKQAVVRTLERLTLDPIILHEKPNRGRTIIEKFTEYAAVGFAVILLSPDDVGCLRAQAPTGLKPRVRQNVVMELGFFLGKLGRERVLALVREEPEFDLPSDYSGVLFVPFDLACRWEFELVKELVAAGYSIDANRLIR